MIEQISGDSRADFLKKARISDTARLLKYIEKRDRGRPRRFGFSCASPIENKEGILRYGGPEKCELLANRFQERLAATPEICMSRDHDRLVATAGR